MINKQFIKVREQALLDLLSHIGFAVLFVMAAIFYQERLYADSAYYIAKLIQKESFHIEHGRYILAFSQWLPLSGIWLKLSLKTILLLYSIGHVLFFYLLYLAGRHAFKLSYAGLLLLSLLTVGISMGYFTPMFELYYGTGLLVMLFALLQWDKKQWLKYAGIVLLIFLIVTSHTFAIVLLFVVLVIDWLRNNTKLRKVYWLIGGVLTGSIIFEIITASSYEQEQAGSFLNSLRTTSYTAVYFQGLFQFLIKNYPDVIGFAMLTLIMTFVKRRFLTGIFATLAIISALSLAVIRHPEIIHTRYQEQVYFIIGAVTVFLLILGILPLLDKKTRLATALILFALAGIRMGVIINTSKDFTQRVAIMQKLIHQADKQGGTKFYVNTSEIEKYSPELNWSYTIETMLLSAIRSPANTFTIATDTDLNFENNKGLLTPDKYLFRRWEIYPVESLNQRYFMLTEGEYRPLDIMHSIH